MGKVMKNSIFSDLDKIIEAAVNSSTKTEELAQAQQAQSVKKAGLVASRSKKNEDVDEAEDEAESEKEPVEKKGGEEKIQKITGKPGDSAESGVSSSKPGTRTSKKLADPPEKVLKNPQYPDIQQKINTLRGSSSLSKKPISASVQQYLKTLSVPEKAALLTYLTNLSQLMAPIKKPDEVNEPSDVGLITKFKGSAKKSKEEPAEDKKETPKKGSGVVVVGED